MRAWLSSERRPPTLTNSCVVWLPHARNAAQWRKTCTIGNADLPRTNQRIQHLFLRLPRATYAPRRTCPHSITRIPPAHPQPRTVESKEACHSEERDANGHHVDHLHDQKHPRGADVYGMTPVARLEYTKTKGVGEKARCLGVTQAVERMDASEDF